MVGKTLKIRAGLVKVDKDRVELAERASFDEPVLGISSPRFCSGIAGSSDIPSLAGLDPHL